MQTDLRLVAVGDIKEKFVVPAYQRGYRWGRDEVTALLDDLESIEASENLDYCLQPIVVKRLSDDRYELVDGQQRLTTLFLLMLFMQRERFRRSGPSFSMSYVTRSESASFLNELDPARRDANIDFFHMANAYDCIAEWFEAKGHRAELVATEIFTHLGRRVKVIWYEAGADAPSEALFARLNAGRIPLTNAELIKALLLRDSARQIELGTQWDTVEKRLRDRGLWAFVTNRAATSYPNRIELVFESMIESKSADRLHTFHAFKARIDDGDATDAIWQDVVARMELFEEWYDDRDLYHWIGYLISTGGTGELRALVTEASKKTKSQFRASLCARITKRLGLSREAVDDIAYDTHRERCEHLLLLFNVETSRRLRHSLERYPFHAHKGESWSLEHIHAQNAAELRRKDQWQTWLREHAKALANTPVADAAARDALVGEISEQLADLTHEKFDALATRAIALLQATDAGLDLHGITNLALLPSETNSALNNAVFEVKRQRVLELDRTGSYLPICTRNVFLKYYTASGDQQLQFWSAQDRAAYLDAILDAIGGYLEEAP